MTVPTEHSATSPDPLTGISPDTVRSLTEQARLYIDSVTKDYRSTPPERPGGFGGEGVVSGRDVEEWPGRVARFRERWEARPEHVRTAILAKAFPSKRKCFWVPPAQDPSTRGGYVPSLVVEDEAGHTPLTGHGTGSAPWVWGQTLEQAQSVCAQANADSFGLSPQEANDIVMSSLAATSDVLDVAPTDLNRYPR